MPFGLAARELLRAANVAGEIVAGAHGLAEAGLEGGSNQAYRTARIRWT